MHPTGTGRSHSTNTGPAEQMRQSGKVLGELRKWLTTHAEERRGEGAAFSQALLPSVLSLEWDLDNWAEALARPRIGIYGASQAGKSTFISRLLAGNNGRSVFPADKKLSFIEDINPPGEGQEATAVVTRYYSTDNESELPSVVLADRADLMGVLTSGFNLTTRLDDPGRFQHPMQLDDLMKFTGEDRDNRSSPEWDHWRSDILRTYRIARRRFRHAAYPIEFDSLVACLSAVRGLQEDAAVGLAARLLWRGSDQVASLLLELLASPLMRHRVMTVPWSSLRLLLTRVLAVGSSGPREEVSSKAYGKMSWDQFGLEDRGGSLHVVQGIPNRGQLSAKIMHALTVELRIPLIASRLNSRTRGLLAQYDLMDYPGSQRHTYNYSEEELKDPNPRLGLIERGRIDYGFRSQGAQRPLDVLLFLQKYGTPADAVTVADQLDHWFEFWRGPEDASRDGLPSGLFAGITHFDMMLNVLRKSAYSALDKFFLDDWLPNIPEKARAFIGAGSPLAGLYWLAMGTDRIFRNPAEESSLQKQYEGTSAIQNWIHDPSGRWLVVCDDNDRGVHSLLAAMMGSNTTPDLSRLCRDHLSSRLNDIANNLRQHLPVSDDASIRAGLRRNQARELTEGFLDPGADEERLLVNYLKLRRALDVPVLSMSVQLGAGATDGPRLWYRNILNQWAASAGKRLSGLDRSNAERWQQLVDWIRQSLAREEHEERFVAAVGVFPRSSGVRAGAVDTNSYFAAAMVCDSLYEQDRAAAVRPAAPALFDSSRIDWEARIREGLLATLVKHAEDSAMTGGRQALPGDEEGLLVLGDLLELIGVVDKAEW